jgi:hypothetical protein
MSTPTIKAFVRTIQKTPYTRTAVYAVHGFWSGDSVRVMQSKELGSSPPVWEKPRINWSCGGEDHAQEPDRFFAAECFAAALKNAARLARRWTPKVSTPKPPTS